MYIKQNQGVKTIMNMRFFNFNFQHENWQRHKQQNLYTYYRNNHLVIRSYNTIVGIVDLNKNILYRTTTKYSVTTSKQLTQYASSNALTTEYIDDNEIKLFLNLLNF